MRRWVERGATWGSALAAVVVLTSAGVHPAAAVLLGVVVALVVAGVLSAVAS